MSVTTLTRSDVRDFSRSLRDICVAHPAADVWSPAQPCDDRDPAARGALLGAGWFDLPSAGEGLAFLGPAAIELGRALVSIDCIDAALGHGVALGPALAGGLTLTRYAVVGESVWMFDTESVDLVEVVAATPISHLDAQNVSIVETRPMGPATLTDGQIDAWIAAMTGYLAGLAVGASELAMTHAVGRMAFGKPLSSIEAVGVKLADSASTIEGLQMAAECEPSPDVLRYAARAVPGVMKDSHQILGALGFTREFPLQRFSRRAAALEAWTVPMVATLDVMREGQI